MGDKETKKGFGCEACGEGRMKNTTRPLGKVRESGARTRGNRWGSGHRGPLGLRGRGDRRAAGGLGPGGNLRGNTEAE